jgi:predicted 3-demethylubiquinone-9 3-methyltransferase (glyoxalase superfamily)
LLEAKRALPVGISEERHAEPTRLVSRSPTARVLFRGNDMRKITPFLWFDKEAEDAANFYVSVFKNSKITSVGRYGEAGPGAKGTVMSVTFELEGQPFYALNGGPHYTFTPAISLFVSCETQGEVDALWDKLCDGGKPNRCGWLTDKFGLSWQIIPSVLGKLLQSPDRAGSNRAMQAMLAMDKLDIRALQDAFDGK